MLTACTNIANALSAAGVTQAAIPATDGGMERPGDRRVQRGLGGDHRGSQRHEHGRRRGVGERLVRTERFGWRLPGERRRRGELRGQLQRERELYPAVRHGELHPGTALGDLLGQLHGDVSGVGERTGGQLPGLLFGRVQWRV